MFFDSHARFPDSACECHSWPDVRQESAYPTESDNRQLVGMVFTAEGPVVELEEW